MRYLLPGVVVGAAKEHRGGFGKGLFNQLGKPGSCRTPAHTCRRQGLGQAGGVCRMRRRRALGSPPPCGGLSAGLGAVGWACQVRADCLGGLPDCEPRAGCGQMALGGFAMRESPPGWREPAPGEPVVMPCSSLADLGSGPGGVTRPGGRRFGVASGPEKPVPVPVVGRCRVPGRPRGGVLGPYLRKTSVYCMMNPSDFSDERMTGT